MEHRFITDHTMGTCFLFRLGEVRPEAEPRGRVAAPSGHAGDPPSAVVDNINAFLNEVRRRRHWSFNLGWAMAPDSNIGGSSDRRIIYIYDLPFRRNEEEPRTSGVGVAVWGGAEYHR